MSESLDQEIRTLQSIFWSERDPDGLAFAPLAEAFVRKGDLREALDLLTDGTSRHPDYATGHVVATRLYVEQGMHAEAEFAARRVLDLDPENTVALGALVNVLHATGAAAEAALMRSALVNADPESDEARAAELLPLPDAVAADVEEIAEDPLDAPEVLLAGDGGAAADDDLADALDALGLGDTETEFASLEDLGAGLEEPALAVLLDPPEVVEDAGSESGDVSDQMTAGDVDFDPMIDLDTFGAPEDAVLETDFPVMELDGLAPDEPAGDVSEVGMPEVVMDLGGLAPDAEPEPVMDLAGLAPDAEPEPVMDLAGLAPDAEPEPVMDLAGLAPDAEPEPVMDLAGLAPDAEPEAVMDLAGLAPDAEPEPVMDLAGLAPDAEPEPVMDLAGLAPDTEPEPVMDLAGLAPDAEPEPVMDLAGLAPDAEPEPVMDLGSLAPEEPADPHGDVAPAVSPKEDPHVENGEPVYTRTLAELYVRQGFTDQALDVYRQLLAADPAAQDLRERVSELEGGVPTEPSGSDAESAAESEELETLARDLAESGAEEHEVETPFAWTDEREAGSDAVPSDEGVAGYFEDLLGWGSREDS